MSRTFAGPRGPVPVLRGVDLVVERGEVVAILGPSGSGKSTLLHLLAGLDRLGSDMGAAAAPRTAAAAAGPAAGEIWWGDLAVHRHPPRRLARSRAEHVGLVFQNHYLLDDLTALENVTLPGRIRGDLDRERGAELLRAVGLEARADHRPARLSGGERQRVAVARALYHRPALLLADEPTGSLDRATANEVYRQLLAAAEREGAAVVVVTHDEAMVDDLPRRYLLTGGRLVPRGER